VTKQMKGQRWSPELWTRV